MSITKPGRSAQSDLSKPLGAFFVLLVGMPICFAGFWKHQSPYIGYNDDFFYYLQIARNFATHGVSTFNGLYPTNGYHPLWMLSLALLYKLAPGASFFYLLQTIIVGSGLLTYLLARRALLYGSRNTALATVFAVAIACTTFIFRTGMEATIAVPLLFLFVIYRIGPDFQFTSRQAVVYGLLGSLAVLARLDIAFLLLLLLACDLAAFGGRIVLSKVPWIALGALPLFAYLASNVVVFHTLLPVSGTAKELRFHHTPSFYPLHHIFLYQQDMIILLGGGVLSEAVLLLWLVAGLRKSGSQPTALAPAKDISYRSVLWAIALFPVLFAAVELVLSDWPLFIWYLYPAPLIFFGAMVCVLRFVDVTPKIARLTLSVAALALVLLAGVYTVHAARRGPWPLRDVLGLDQSVAQFITAHPGIYAMGDRAGLVGYLSPSPVIQMEGLVMDKPFLENIANQVELHTVLRKYHVRYYIISYYGDPPRPGACIDYAESEVPGDDSKKMRGRFCTPVAAWSANSRNYLIFDLGSMP